MINLIKYIEKGLEKQLLVYEKSIERDEEMREQKKRIKEDKRKKNAKSRK